MADGSAGPINDEQRKYLGIAFMNSTGAVDQLNSVADLLPPFKHFSERVEVLALLRENNKRRPGAVFFLMISNILKATQAPGRLMVGAFERKTPQLTDRVSHDNASLDPEELSRMLGAANRRTEDDSELDLCLVRDVVPSARRPFQRRK